MGKLSCRFEAPLRILVIGASLASTAACNQLLGDPFDVTRAKHDAGERVDDQTGTGGESMPTGGRRAQAGDGDTEKPDAEPDDNKSDEPKMPKMPDTNAGKAAPASNAGSMSTAPADPPDANPMTQQSMGDPDEPDAGPADTTMAELDGCPATFEVSNDIRYPTTSQGDLQFAMSDRIDTDTDPRCDPLTTKHCVVVAKSIRVPAGGNLGVIGTRALVLLAANDVTLDGIVNVGGGDGAAGARQYNGPGDHSAGTAIAPSGGGGHSTPGGGTCDGRGGGRSIPLGLLAGGDGAPADSAGCTAGGGGGGALQLVSLCGTIRVTNYINARGGGGIGGGLWNKVCVDGYGGGAGGTVWLQAKTVDLISPQTRPMVIQLSGGGGGGGACTLPDAMNQAGEQGTGHPPNRQPAPGGVCEVGVVVGGAGGLGGLQNMNPTPGGKPTGNAFCGGGGGARGRLVLQTPSLRCEGSAAYHEGACEEVPLVVRD